jgi:hypothetical protein
VDVDDGEERLDAVQHLLARRGLVSLAIFSPIFRPGGGWRAGAAPACCFAAHGACRLLPGARSWVGPLGWASTAGGSGVGVRFFVRHMVRAGFSEPCSDQSRSSEVRFEDALVVFDLVEISFFAAVARPSACIISSFFLMVASRSSSYAESSCLLSTSCLVPSFLGLFPFSSSLTSSPSPSLSSSSSST